MNRTLTVHLSLRTVILTLGVLLAVYVASLIPDILVMLLVALIISAAMLPGVDYFQSRLKWPRLPAILAMFGLIFLFLLLIGLIVVPTLIDQVQTLIKNLPEYTAKVRQTYTWVLELEQRFPWLPAPGDVAAQVSAFAAGWLSSSLGWAGRILGGIMTVFVVLITTFFILLDGPDLKRGLLSLIPPDYRPKWEAQIDPVALKLGAYVQGVLVSIGFLTAYLAITLSIAGVPLAVALAILAGFMEIIPLVGSLLGSIPAILIALTVSWQLALITAGIFLLGNFLQGNFVAP
ncbi:MAG: AI-2E family transporter, partial [Candidatus Sericytochromatia bacterium]